MSTSKNDYLSDLVQSLSRIDHIRPEDFPNIDLYMDQVTTFMSTNLSNSKRHEDDKILTKTMINNYAKDNLLPSPVKKKYSKDHMIVLLYIYYFKNVLSISDIQNILNPLTERFFGSDAKSDEVNMEKIYKESYRVVKEAFVSISDDVDKKTKVCQESFSEVENQSDRDFLQLFSLICMLGYDVFLKKQAIGNLIDKIKADEDALKQEEAAKKEAAKKEAAARKEAAKKESSKKDTAKTAKKEVSKKTTSE